MSSVAEQLEQMKARLAARAGREASNWIPEKAGEMVAGVIEEVAWEEGDYGPYRRITIFDDATPDVEHVVRGFGKVLAQELDRINPAVGDGIVIVYKGTDTVKKGKFAGKDFKNWSVTGVPANPSAAVDQDELRRQAQAALEAEAAEPWADDED